MADPILNFLFINSAKSWGGNEKWTYLASSSLANNHNVYCTYRKDCVGKNFNIPKFKLPLMSEADIYTICRLIHIVLTKKIDVIIPTKQKDYVLGGMVAKLLHRKNVLRLGIVRNITQSNIKKFIYKNLADGIIVNAPQIQEVLVEGGIKKEKVRVIFNGVDCQNIDEKIAPLKKPFPFLITSVGSLIGRKGFTEVLKSFAQFLKSYQISDAGLVIIGDGYLREKLAERAKLLGIEKQVIFTGFSENPYSYLSMSDVFILLSKNEGISNAMLEAMYLKNAIITSDAGGANYAINDGQNGFLVPRDDIEIIAKKLFLLYNDTEFRKSMGEQAYKATNDKFSLTRMKQDIVEFCSQL